jgi:hypothetical protein
MAGGVQVPSRDGLRNQTRRAQGAQARGKEGNQGCCESGETKGKAMNYDEKELLQPIWSTRTVLKGGFVCHLEDAEVNEWLEFAHTTPQWERVSQLSVEKQNVRGLPPETVNEIAMRIQRDEQQIDRELYEIGKSWFAGLVERQEE